MPLQRPNGNRNKALQGVLSRQVGMGTRTCLMLACHCPQLGVLWGGFGVEQTQHSRAPLLNAVPFPWDLSTVPPKGSSGCLASPCADCSPVAVSRWELSPPGQDTAVFPEPLREIRAGSATRCPAALGEQLDPGEHAHSKGASVEDAPTRRGWEPRLQGGVLGRLKCLKWL